MKIYLFPIARPSAVIRHDKASVDLVLRSGHCFGQRFLATPSPSAEDRLSLFYQTVLGFPQSRPIIGQGRRIGRWNASEVGRLQFAVCVI